MFYKSRIQCLVGIALFCLILAGCTGGSSGPSQSAKPTFRVDGVVDGATYDGPVAPKVVLGPGTTLQTLTLNDEAFQSGTQVSLPGKYTLEVVVKNSKGETAVGSITFTITAPKEPHPEGAFRVPAQYSTIQGAIDAASDGDTIVVSAGTYHENVHIEGKEIKLASTDPLDPDVVSSTIIDGSTIGPVIAIEGERTKVEITGFTITNGDSTFGGGFSISNASVTLRYNLITANSASEGGGIYFNASDKSPTFVVEHNILTGNSAPLGGAFIIEGHGTIAENIFRANESGLYLRGGTYEISHNEICDNDGTGLQLEQGLHTITENEIALNGESGMQLFEGEHVITKNTVTGNTMGGLYLGDGKHTITNNLISNNTHESYGSGLIAFFGQHRIEYNTVTGNTARGEVNAAGGGGLYLVEGEHIIANNIVTHNTALLGNGGGLYMKDGKHSITDNTFSDNRVTGTSRELPPVEPGGVYIEVIGGSGGGLYGRGGKYVIIDNVLEDNACDSEVGDGGGLFLFLSEGTLMNNLVSGNLATYGGGISINQSIYLVSGNTIDKNTASIQGGGLNVYEGEQTISDNIVRSNLAQYGGGMSVSGQTTIMDNEVSDNTATLLGGGLYVDGASHSINGNIIRNNVVSQGSGGGLYVSAIRSNIFGNQVVGNFAGGEVTSDEAVYEITGGGGGLYVYGGSSVITNNEIRDNRTAEYGGGLHLLLGVHVVSDNDVIENASGNDGGGLYCGHSWYPRHPLTVTRLTGNWFQGNSADGNGGAVGVKAESSITDAVGNLLPIPDTHNDYQDNSPDDVYYQ